MMIPGSKYLHLSVVLSSVLVLSGCSGLDALKVDAVGDTVDYQKSANSVRALSIPPGLSSPGFDSSYTSSQGNTSSVANASVVETPVTAQTQQIASASRATAISTLDSAPSVSRPSPSSGGGSSLGAALMAQSESDGQASTQTAIPDTAIQAEAPAPVVARNSNLPQVAMIRLKGGEPALAINAPYASAWKVLTPLLVKAGFDVGKQQPNQGIITTTYQGSGSASLSKGQSYLILLAENASKQSFIGVADSNGKPASEAIAQAALALIKTEFEK